MTARLTIIGAGSHVDVVEGTARQTGQWPTIRKTTLEDFHQCAATCDEADYFICAIGDNQKRMRVVTLAPPGLQWATIVHPRATVAATATIGVGTVVCAGAIVQEHCHIGNHCILNTHSSTDHHSKFHDFVHVAPSVTLCGNVTLGQGVFIGAGATIMPAKIIAPWGIIKAQELVNDSSGPIPVYRPMICDEWHDKVMLVLHKTALTSQTPCYSFVKSCEDYLTNLFGMPVLLLNSGTSATHCLFLALKFKYPALETIYVPNHVYVAVWNTALYEYPASKLEVLPWDEKTWNADFKDLDKLRPNSAVVVVHNVGNIVNVPLLKRQRPDLVFVEDNCEGFGGKYQGQWTGTASFCSSISFFANKNVTCGEGGAFITADSETHEYIKKVTNQGMTSERYVHDVLGYNYRITNLQAALLYPQLQNMETILAMKELLFAKYKSLLKHPRIKWPLRDPQTNSSNWLLVISIDGSVYSNAKKYFDERLIDTRPFFYDIHRHQHTQEIHNPHHGNNTTTTDEIIMFPSYPKLSHLEICYICDCIEKYCSAQL